MPGGFPGGMGGMSGFPGGMPGGMEGAPGGMGGAGMPDLSQLLSDPELLQAFQVLLSQLKISSGVALWYFSLRMM